MNSSIYFVKLYDIDRGNATFTHLQLSQKFKETNCGKVEFGLINLDKMFSKRITQNLIALSLPHFNSKDHMRGKVRPNIIQIELLEISILWDLDDDEEISFIVEPQ